MLRVHRDDLAAAGARGLHHEVAGHHQAFLVGQRDPLPRPERGQGGVEPGRAHHRVHHDVRVRMGRGLDQHLGPAGPAVVRFRAPRSPAKAGTPLRHLPLELLAIPAAGEGDELEVVPLAAQHVERAATDRAGRAQHCHPASLAVAH